jgi:hypothetical protein
MNESYDPVCNISDHYNNKKSGTIDIKAKKNDPSFIYFLMAMIWGGIIFYLSKKFAANDFWIIPLSVLILSIPVAICGIYSGTVKQIRTAAAFKDRGVIHRFVTARPLMLILIVCWAIVTTFFMLIQFHTYSRIEWVSFFMVIPVFWLVFNFFKHLISKELKPYMVTNWALEWARILTSIIMLLVYVILVKCFGNIPEYASIQDAFSAQKGLVSDMTGSAMVHEASQYLSFYNGFKAYTISRTGTMNDWWPLLFFTMGGYVVFFNACAMLSCFLIPKSEYRRFFGAPTDADDPLPVSGRRVFITSAIFTFIAIFIYVPLFAYLEAWFQQKPQFAETRKKLEIIVIKNFEQIDDSLFKEGTIAKIDAARMEALKKVDVSFAVLGGQIDNAFFRLENNVDNYLDWYYSLLGEYSRIASMMVGDLEFYMKRKFKEYLLEGDAFNEFENSLERAIAKHQEVLEGYKKIVEKIMQENQVSPIDPSSYKIVQKTSIETILNRSIHDDFIAFEQRLVVSGGIGAVAGVVTTLVVSKILGKMTIKAIFKLAAKALAKVMASKAAGSACGAAGGALIGGAIGSVIPGAGTVAGAAVGGVIGGLVVGVSVDKLILELEEHLNRDEFKKKILSAIEEARKELKTELKLSSALKNTQQTKMLSVCMV